MTGVTITVNPAQAAALRRAFADLGRIAKEDRARPLTVAAEKMLNSTKRRLGGTTDPDGNAWPSLNADYAAQKRGGGMLRESGMLAGAASLKHDLRGDTVAIGTNRIYAAIHQFGGKITPKTSGGRLAFMLGGRRLFARSVTIPARPFLGFSRDDIEEVSAIFAQHAARAMRGS